MLRRAASCLVISLLHTASAAATNPAKEPYEQVQATRTAVDALSKKDATPAQLRRGVAQLEESLRYLDQPDIHALAVGSPFFAAMMCASTWRACMPAWA